MVNQIKNLIFENQLYRKYRNFILYSIIGVSGVAIDFVLFLILFNIFNFDKSLSTIVSTTAGITNNFIWNSVLNFKVKDRIISRFISFYGIGILGLTLTLVIFVVFVDLFTYNANFIKLISIIIVVIVQYTLNKNISFKENLLYSREKLWNFFKENYQILLLNFIFISIVLTWIKIIPFNNAPDERSHYEYNIEFIIENHRLPVSGKDDISAYQRCRDNDFGKIPCVISYSVYPGLNYVVSATTARVSSDILGISYVKGARLASLFWGVIFLNLLFLLVREFIQDKSVALIITFSFAFIPQVLFISSYVNQDIHSLAIFAGVLLFLLRLFKNFSIQNQLLFSFFFGLLLSAKYNYFLFIPFIAIALPIYFKTRKIGLGKIVQFGFMLGLSTILLSGFWYIRNLFLYGDPTGQIFMLNKMAEYHELGMEWSIFSLQTWTFLFEYQFFEKLFNSFFIRFGYMNLGPEEVYAPLQFSVVVSGIYLLIEVFLDKLKTIKLFGLGMILIFTANLLLLIYNSVKFDIQPQGRYLFPILIPSTIFISYLISKDKKYRKYIFLMASLILLLLLKSYEILIVTYF